MTYSDATENVDPQLLQPPPSLPPSRAGSLGVPSQQNKRDADGDDDGDNDSVQSGTGPARKRQKLNLYKCNQCRLARKKVRTLPR